MFDAQCLTQQYLTWQLQIRVVMERKFGVRVAVGGSRVGDVGQRHRSVTSASNAGHVIRSSDVSSGESERAQATFPIARYEVSAQSKE